MSVTEDMWLAERRNIAPGGIYPFKAQSRGYASAKDVAVRIIAVNRWPR